SKRGIPARVPVGCDKDRGSQACAPHRHYRALPPTPAFGGGTFPQPPVGGLIPGSTPRLGMRRYLPIPGSTAVGDAAVPSPNLRLGDSSRAPPRSGMRQCLPPTSSWGTYPWPPAFRPSGRLLAGSAPFWRVL